MKEFFSKLNSMTLFGKIASLLLVGGAIYGGTVGYKKAFPEKAKVANVTTKATGLPPLSYDKNSNAPLKPLPSFNEAADVQAPEVRGQIMGWNAFASANYSVGGLSTAKGSLCEQLGLNIRLTVQNSCTEQGNQLYKFAQQVHDGQPNPTEGCHFVNWMGDGCPSYLANLNTRLIKDFGPEFRAEVVDFTGGSFGEDKWLLKAKYAKNPAGSVTVTVRMDGDWNISIIKCQLMGWPVNYQFGTYDRTKVNFVEAPNSDYVAAGQVYISGAKQTLKMIENGKFTGKDTTVSASGVASWFPVDMQTVQQKGGLVTVASTKEYGAQMGCAIVMIKKWADDNRPIVERMIEAFGKGGDQIKSHDEALRFSAKVSEVVFADKEKNADAWYNAYKSFDVTDDDGNVVNVGGSRAFSLADAASYVGISGGTDKYKEVFTTFANIDMEAYSDIVGKIPPYEECVDFSFLKAVYARNKAAGTEGAVSKVDFKQAQKGAMIGDAAFAIEFATGSAVISPKSYPTLDKIVGLLTNANNTFVDLSGHTDNTGDPAKNLTLSEQRAQAVATYLSGKNPEIDDEGKLTTKGYGQQNPVNPADNQNDLLVKAKNRRVEIKLFKAKQ